MKRFIAFLLIATLGLAQTIPPAVGVYSLSGFGSGGSGTGGSAALFASTASATVANTTTETSIAGTGSGTKTTPANYFTAGSTFVVEATGFYSSAAVDTLNIKIKGGATVAATTGAIAYGALTNKVFTVRCLITCRTTGASGTFIANTLWDTAGSALVPQDAQMLNTTTFTLDTTNTIAWDTTATWSTASASDTITGTNFMLYTIGSATGGSSINISGTPVAGQSAEWTNSNTIQGVNTTGTVNYVKSTSPTLVTPILGTPTSVTLTNATGLPLTTGVTGILPIANGGTATATPALVAGTNISITGSWPNQTINATGGAGSGTVNSGTANQVAFYSSTGTAVSGDTLLADNGTTVAYTGTGGVSAVSFNGTGATPAAMTLAAGTGSIPALTANSAGFSAPATGGTAYVVKFAPTATAGSLEIAAPTTIDGVNSAQLSFVAFTGTGNYVKSTSPSLAGVVTNGGTEVTTATPVPALSIDVTKELNTKSISVDSTFTFSGTPGTTDQWFGMRVKNTDTNSHVLTIPSSFSISNQATITTTTIQAGGTLYFVWNYDGSVYNLYGDPNLSVLTNTGGFSRVGTQYDTTSSTTLGNVTNLTANVKAGATYQFRAQINVTAGTTGGVKLAMGGTATATSIIYVIKYFDNTTPSLLVVSRQTALAGAASATTSTAYTAEIEGTIVVNAAGTLTVQGAQAVSNGTTTSVLVGSYLEVIGR